MTQHRTRASRRVPLHAALAMAVCLGGAVGARASRDGPSRLESLSIQIAVELDPQARPREIRRQLERLAEGARRAVPRGLAPHQQRERFNRFFFSDAGFKPASDQDSAESLLIHQVLRRRQGTCVGLTQVYLILAERLSLPVVGSATPTHLFVRWVDEEGQVNSELLESGAEHSDSEYRIRHRIQEADPANPVFLRNLTSLEVAARLYNNRGVIRSRAGSLDSAAADYQRAAVMDPRFPAPAYNRGLDQLSSGRPAEALADFDLAIALYPADSWALNNRGLAKSRLGRRAEAAEDFQKALAVEPDFPAAKKNLELVMRAAAGSTEAQGVSAAQPAQPGAADGEPAGPRP